MLGMAEPAGGRADQLDAAFAGDRRARDAVTVLLHDPDHRDGTLDAVARAAAAGSEPALDMLLAAIDDHGIARSAIRKLVLDPPTIDDIHQDVLIVVAEKIGTFRGESRFTTWLYRVARFKAIDHLRRQRDSVSLGDDESRYPTDAIRVSSLIANRATIRGAVDELPDHYRDAVVLRDIECLPYEEIATRAGIPLNTAKTRVARGRALVAAKIRSGGD
jgi:RNA polymerase sigma-70 factor, ECF subfamily